jgi:hypothetical protein
VTIRGGAGPEVGTPASITTWHAAGNVLTATIDPLVVLDASGLGAGWTVEAQSEAAGPVPEIGGLGPGQAPIRLDQGVVVARAASDEGMGETRLPAMPITVSQSAPATSTVVTLTIVGGSLAS